MKLIKDVMTRGAETIRPDATLLDAARAMRDQEIGCLPVVENGAVVGIVTDRDIVLRAVADGRAPDSVHARDAMTDNPATIAEDSTIDEAVRLMKRRAIRRLVVVDTKGHPTGILSLGDLAACKDDHDTAVFATDVFKDVCAST